MLNMFCPAGWGCAPNPGGAPGMNPGATAAVPGAALPKGEVAADAADAAEAADAADATPPAGAEPKEKLDAGAAGGGFLSAPN